MRAGARAGTGLCFLTDTQPASILHASSGLPARLGDTPPFLVVYGYVTNNLGVGECGKMNLFHPRGRGPHHGAEPVVLASPDGCSHTHLPPHPCRVARQAIPHAPAAPRTPQAPTHTLQRTQALSRTDPQTAVRDLCTGSQCTLQGAGLATAAQPRQRSGDSHAQCGQGVLCPTQALPARPARNGRPSARRRAVQSRLGRQCKME
jgi:hypothetical protein